MKSAWETELQLEVTDFDGYPCLRLGGEGQGRGAALLERALGRLLERDETRVILDTREVRFLDPHCFDVLSEAIQRLELAGGVLVVVDQSLPVERTLKLLNIERLVTVVPSLSQAAAFLDWHE